MRGRLSARLDKVERRLMLSDADLEFQREVRHKYNLICVSNRALTAATLFTLARRKYPDWIEEEFDRPIPFESIGKRTHKAAVAAAREVKVPQMSPEEFAEEANRNISEGFKAAGLDLNSEEDWEKCLEYYSKKEVSDDTEKPTKKN